MKRKHNSSRVFINRDIRSRQVRCIDHNDENLGVISTYAAIGIAQDAGLDLVMVSKYNPDQIPTCKILDSGKYKYDLSKRQKDLAKKKRESAVKIKEIKFRPCTDINDLRVKAKKANKFFDEGCRIKIAIKFKGRELSHRDVAEDRLDMFLDLLGDIDFLELPQLNGKFMTCIIVRSKGKNIRKAI